jgi:hypothetical protein
MCGVTCSPIFALFLSFTYVAWIIRQNLLWKPSSSSVVYSAKMSTNKYNAVEIQDSALFKKFKNQSSTLNIDAI